jgi:hypothetical protein
MQLGKPLLPVMVEHMRPELLPLDVARVQVVDYSIPGEESAIQLMVALSGLKPVNHLPDPLPAPPPVPISYLSDLSRRIAVETLSLDEQLALVGRLESSLDRSEDTDDRAAVMNLVQRLGRRYDLYAETERRIRRIASLPGATTPAIDSSALPQHASMDTAFTKPSSPSSNNASESWSIVAIEAPFLATWRLRLHLTNEQHVVELRTGLTNKVLIDNEVVWKSVRTLRQEEFQISDGDVTRSLKIESNWKSATAFSDHIFIDGHDLFTVTDKNRPSA